MPEPEELARIEIDALLNRCGWQVQNKSAVNLHSQRGVAVRELSFKTGEPDYTLFVDGKSVGTVEAKPVGHSLTGVEEQSEKYVKGKNEMEMGSGKPYCYFLVCELWLHPYGEKAKGAFCGGALSRDVSRQSGAVDFQRRSGPTALFGFT